jgi:hypothetical protein
LILMVWNRALSDAERVQAEAAAAGRLSNLNQ